MFNLCLGEVRAAQFTESLCILTHTDTEEGRANEKVGAAECRQTTHTPPLFSFNLVVTNQILVWTFRTES